MASSQSFPERPDARFGPGMSEGFQMFGPDGMPAQFYQSMHMPFGQQPQSSSSSHHDNRGPYMDASAMGHMPPHGMAMAGHPMQHTTFISSQYQMPPQHMQMAGSSELGAHMFADGSMAYDGESSMSAMGDDSMEMRLQIAQQAQQAAADMNGGMFPCPYCDKQYFGKHARSIWRRHLQDKHAIPLSQQPRRTRWDGDVNRPKNAEERRQRMLESKRRWARKKRMMDKEARTAGGEAGASMSPDMSDDEDSAMSPEDVKENHFAQPAKADAAPGGTLSMRAPLAPIANAVDNVPADVSQPAKRKRESKPKGPQQIKFHHMTTADIPSYGEHGTGHPMGPTVWTFTDGKPATGPQMGASAARIADRSGPHGGVTAARTFKREASAPSLPPQVASSMMPMSPRRAFGHVDGNTNRLARSVSSIDAFYGAGKPAFQNESSKPTQTTRFMEPYNAAAVASKGQAVPKSGPKRASKVAARSEEKENAVPLSGNKTDQESRIAGKILSPMSTNKQGKSVSIGGTYPIEGHRISPPSNERQSLEALDAAVAGGQRSTVSPLQRRHLGENESGMADNSASPLGKSRRLPPLVKTPLRPARLADAPTPDTAMGLSTGLGSTSIHRPRPGGLATPTSSRMERLLGGSTSIGLTPFDARLAGNASVTRSGFFARPSPLKRGEGDQFSSPQHLNLTQSLGLAPHSTMKSSSSAIGGGMGSVSATPFIHSFLNLNSNSPWTRDLWPESVYRQSTYSTQDKQGSPSASGISKTSSHGKSLRSGAGRPSQSSEAHGSTHEDDEDEDDVPATLFLAETPSRPAKMRHITAAASFLGSPTSSHSSAKKRRHPHSQVGSPNHAASGKSLDTRSPLRSSQRFGTPTTSFDGELAATRVATDRSFNSSSPSSSS